MRIAYNIKWDVDTDENNNDLPKEIEVPDYIDEECIGDYLSNLTGFCHDGFNLSKKGVE